MRSSSFSYKVLSYIPLHIFFQAVRINKSYRKNIQYLVTLSAVGFSFIHWRVLVFTSFSFSPSYINLSTITVFQTSPMVGFLSYRNIPLPADVPSANCIWRLWVSVQYFLSIMQSSFQA
jgi:hypothetical protein